MYTDDYRKQSYLEMHMSWIDRQFQKHHMLLWLSDTLGTAAHTVKLLTVFLRSTVFRNVGWVGLDHASSKNHGLGWVGSTNMDPCPSL